MATIKVSNKKVIQNANETIKFIQHQRHKNECNAIKRIIYDFHNVYTRKWIFKRDILEWFKDAGPFAILGFIGYPFSVVLRLYMYSSKPKTSVPFVMQEWMLKDEFGSVYNLESSLYESQEYLCRKLKCMAKNNEEKDMVLSLKEAETLNIC